ncbi:MAG: NAD-dependent epimerase/dehydratase family protein [Promethearchaeota archaeon]
MIRGKKIFITGGAGFIGSHLTEKLFRRNDVICFDNLFRGSNIELLQKKYGSDFEKAVALVRGDVKDRKTLEKAVKDSRPDYVFHLASVAGVATVIKNPVETLEVNVIGSYNLLQSIRQMPIEKLVFTSTSEVYGPFTFQTKEGDYTTQGSPYDPRWSYSTSKLFVEHMCTAYEREYGTPVAIARLFNVYGSRQIGEGAIHNFIVNCLEKEPINIYGDGSQIRAWCYIDDCIQGLLLLSEKGKGAYNVGNPKEALTVYSLALKIREKINPETPIFFVGKSPYTDVSVRVPSIEKITKLGYKPQVYLDEGLERTIRWYKRNLKSPRDT